MTFTDIITHFQANRGRFADLAWDDPHQLSPAQLRAVSASLQRFQRGQGQGSHLLALAEQLGAADYAAAAPCYLREQADHADILGQFMDRQGVPRLPPRGPAAFHGLGPALGQLWVVHALLMAEVVGTIYYRALYQATFSGLLQQICRRLLRDKEMHLLYHCLAIRQFAPSRNWLSAWLAKQGCRVLLAGTALAVYAASHRTLRAGGYGLGRFCAAIAAEYARAEQLPPAAGLLAVRGGQLVAPAPGPAGAWQWPAPHLRAVQ